MSYRPGDLRHGIRGAFNALKLCVSAFDMPLDTSEKLEFLSDTEKSADRIVVLLAEFEAIPDVSAPATPGKIATAPA